MAEMEQRKTGEQARAGNSVASQLATLEIESLHMGGAERLAELSAHAAAHHVPKAETEWGS